MAETFVLSFVDKLILLEEKTGAGVHYRIMAPFSVPFRDFVSIQKVAKEIADSIGLTQFTFIVVLAKQKQGVGGHIDLSTRDNFVFIEVDPTAMEFPDSVGATLCHEICHKWLQVMGISSPIEMDNEILTDITTVFLGFGKIMLNGCDLKKVTQESVARGTRKITHTRKCGYLDRDQLAFVYRLVCAMRSVPASEYMSGLNYDAVISIRSCDHSFGEYYTEQFHPVDSVGEALKTFQLQSIIQQRQLAELNKCSQYVRQSFCGTVDARVGTAHRTSRKLSERAEMIARIDDVDPALSFLRSIRKRHELRKLAADISASSPMLQKLLECSNAVAEQIGRNDGHFSQPSVAMFNIVTCPQDGTRLRLPQDSPELMVSCPTCRYRFAYNTKCITFSTADLPPKEQPVGWPKRIWKFLRGRS